MIVHYPPEPVLGEAACQNLHFQINKFKFEPKEIRLFLKAFISKCINGLVSAGTIGEIIARCILSLSYDFMALKHIPEDVKGLILPSHFFSNPRSVGDFIQTLVSSNYQAIFQERFKTLPQVLSSTFLHSFGTGLLSFTSWMHLENFKSKMPMDQWQSFLEDCFCKRVAVIMPLNHKGVDLLIPVKFPSVYSFILIQVKNRADMDNSRRFKAAGKKLTSENCFGNRFDANLRFRSYDVITTAGRRNRKVATGNNSPQYLSIYMEIGPETLSAALSEIPAEEMSSFIREYPFHLMLLGFESTQISSYPELLDVFTLFCRRHVENVDLATRLSELKLINPLKYIHSKVDGCNCNGRCDSKRCGCKKQNKSCSQYCICSLHSPDDKNRCTNREN